MTEAAGSVIAFDEDKGWGTVRDARGGEFFFHCTQISGGSRKIDVGTAVTFDVIAGHLGRWEAAAVTPRP